MKPPANLWSNAAILDRIERARGAQLARTGQEVKWADIGRSLKWASSTYSDTKSGKRRLQVEDIGAIGRLLQCSAGWLAFAEGQMWGSADGIFTIEPGVTSATTGEDAAAATARAIAEQAQDARHRTRVAGEGRADRATDARGRSSGPATRGKPSRGR